MIFAIVTLIGVLVLGGLCYYVLAEVFGNFYGLMVAMYPEYFLNTTVDFTYNFVVWLPFFILLVGIISAIVIELRRRSPDAYFQI